MVWNDVHPPSMEATSARLARRRGTAGIVPMNGRRKSNGGVAGDASRPAVVRRFAGLRA
jgi:hypothetical protein